MKYYVNRKEAAEVKGVGVSSIQLLKAENGCVAGCSTGISIYTTTEYLAPGVHEDQEGFVVMEGTGWAKIGDQEFRVEPETSFVAPAGVKHWLKRDADSKPVKVFWFHAAVK